MKLHEVRNAIAEHQNLNVRFGFSDGGAIEAHCHVTEVGFSTKDFVDCGGTRRKTESCVLQTFVANDVDHRLGSETLGKILKAGEVLNLRDDMPVEVEYQSTESNRGTIGVFEIGGVAATENELTFVLRSKATACLAPDQCGIEDPLAQLSGGT